jgi:hypothetical protein
MAGGGFCGEQEAADGFVMRGDEVLHLSQAET